MKCKNYINESCVSDWAQSDTLRDTRECKRGEGEEEQIAVRSKSQIDEHLYKRCRIKEGEPRLEEFIKKNTIYSH